MILNLNKKTRDFLSSSKEIFVLRAKNQPKDVNTPKPLVAWSMDQFYSRLPSRYQFRQDEVRYIIDNYPANHAEYRPIKSNDIPRN